MKITQLNHVAIHVRDLRASCAFYEDILQLTPIARPNFNFPGAWFRIGADQELHLIVRGADNTPPPSERHYAMMVDDINAFTSHLKQHAIEHTGPKPRPDGAQQVFLRDPDGHVIELCTPPTQA